jgi:hypothetical protein
MDFEFLRNISRISRFITRNGGYGPMLELPCPALRVSEDDRTACYESTDHTTHTRAARISTSTTIRAGWLDLDPINIASYNVRPM